jgi:Right handed beta helix region
MSLDQPRALIAAAVFCVAAAAGAARAAEVYPGCAEPGPIGKIWYVDPVNGKTPADGGNGSKAAPWNSLQGVISSVKQPGYSRPLLSTVPYDHYPHPNAEGKRIYADGPSNDPARVQPGDEILLMSGQYGAVNIGVYGTLMTNPAFVTIAAAPGQTPVLAGLVMSATNMWRFQHLAVQSLGKDRAVVVKDQGPSLPTSDIIFESTVIGAPEDVNGWTQADWIAKSHYSGFSALSSPDGLSTKCVSFTGGKIYGARYAVSLFSHNSVFSHNTIDHFGDDALDYGANGLIIADNYVHDNLDVGDGNHPDCMQGYLGPINRATAPKNPKGVSYTAYSNVTIERNRCIRQTDPNIKFPLGMQGIDAFDSDWTNLVVANNVVVTSACWGIGYASVHGGKIINNTVLDDGSNVGTKNPAGKVVCQPWIGVGDTTHEGLSSNDVIVRNNIGVAYRMEKVSPIVTMDHNICLAVDGKGQFINYVNGKPKIDTRPGQYRDQNIIERRGAAVMFVNFDPSKYAFDVSLKPGAPAIGAGNPAGAPPTDITGAPRGNPPDIGAYQYRPSK